MAQFSFETEPAVGSGILDGNKGSLEVSGRTWELLFDFIFCFYLAGFWVQCWQWKLYLAAVLVEDFKG